MLAAKLYMRTAPHPYNPLSYATVVLAACGCPMRAVGTNPCTSLNPIMIGLASVEMMREVQVLVATTGEAGEVPTVGFEVVAIVAERPEVALPKL